MHDADAPLGKGWLWALHWRRPEMEEARGGGRGGGKSWEQRGHREGQGGRSPVSRIAAPCVLPRCKFVQVHACRTTELRRSLGWTVHPGRTFKGPGGGKYVTWSTGPRDTSRESPSVSSRTTVAAWHTTETTMRESKEETRKNRVKEVAARQGREYGKWLAGRQQSLHQLQPIHPGNRHRSLSSRAAEGKGIEQSTRRRRPGGALKAAKGAASAGNAGRADRHAPED
ncbi:hypothetical protein K461DRAFT_148713 [Myriangium duriaei CBS 260.36]|uniref:Uncharacterized protein n=1 Tax=Myriangium duriaei CBS 260.36 TaxID=1168546 RepID=A0A9P4J511_9PEZI|nr:hypothetical protein K461DRAFT_148713 [Myriangium duriaei CBS 260.36]